MPLLPIDSTDDPRVLPYRDLPRSRLPRDQGLMIAEGQLLVQQLLASDYDVVSVLLDQKHADSMLPNIPPEVPIYLVESSMVDQIVGYNFHRGILACGRRRPQRPLSEMSPRLPAAATIVACVDVQDPENLGGILRNCAAFGVDLVLLNECCCDAFSRRVLRVSMGNVLQLSLVPSDDLAADLDYLNNRWGLELFATVLDPSAEPIHRVQRPRRLGLLLGNEAYGLDERWIARCDRRITIPIRAGTDSLNVAVASGICLYYFSR